MTNELLKKYIGVRCVITSSSFSCGVTGEITALDDNWMEVITSKGAQLLNVDYITNITQVKQK